MFTGNLFFKKWSAKEPRTSDTNEIVGGKIFKRMLLTFHFLVDRTYPI